MVKQPPPADAYWSLDNPAGPLPEADDVPAGIGVAARRHLSMFKLAATRSLTSLSDRAKTLLERIDSAAFVFLEATTQVHDGAPGPRYWLADIVRSLPAPDESHPAVRVEEKMG